jgi:two-component system OmpR family sensor kinase/two-component system phosphate regulon sensor histidine kinase PhoR
MAEEIEHYVGEIQEQKSRLEAVLEASPEAVVSTDPQERVTMVNPAAARMLGIRPSDRGRTLEELGSPRGILSACARPRPTGWPCGRWSSGRRPTGPTPPGWTGAKTASRATVAQPASSWRSGT